MKLIKAHIKDFQSIRDTNEFSIDDITCLVGKNEAGKTAILKAIYKINPIIEKDNNFDITDDFPRRDVEDYRQDVENGIRKHAIVSKVTFELENEIEPMINEFGEGVLKSTELILEKGYENKLDFQIQLDEKKAVQNLIIQYKFLSEIQSQLEESDDFETVNEIAKETEQTDDIKKLIAYITPIVKDGFETYVYTKYISAKIPKFMYFDDFFQLNGYENIEALTKREKEKNLKSSDHPLLGLISLARLNTQELTNPNRTQELINKLEGAGNHLTDKILKYWSQNKHIQMRFDVRPARPGDPEGMTTGNNIWSIIYDTRHMVSTNLGYRSRGFVWFFSFLAWYSNIKKENTNIILLLDEPGLSLHAKAQYDLLKYFEKELKPSHQLIYSTHSPFMVDPNNFLRVRIVQDKSIDTNEELTVEETGTKVHSEVLEATKDSLFPLQGALGYDIYQTLFVGPNSLVVEGTSDLLYIQLISSLLNSSGRVSLSSDWVITPVGGSDKIPTFVALLGANNQLNIATLIDFQKKDIQTISNLYKKKLLDKSHVVTFADYVGMEEADIEDLFEPDFYLSLINEEYKKELSKSIKIADLKSKNPRINVKLKDYLQNSPLKNDCEFNHYRPSRYLAEQFHNLSSKISNDTLDKFEKIFIYLNKLIKK